MNSTVSRVFAAALIAAAGAVAVCNAPDAQAAASAGAGARQAAATTAAQTFNVDTVHSSVLFRVRHNNVSNFYGRFNAFTGSFSLASGGNINITVDAKSVDSANAKRDEHLRGPDFFSAEEFSTISFTSSSLRQTAENTFEAQGTLKLRGVSKPLTVTITRTGQGTGRGGATVAGLEARFTVKRTDFGITYATESVSDEVELIVALQGAAR